jgi:hypothetical protein
MKMLPPHEKPRPMSRGTSIRLNGVAASGLWIAVMCDLTNPSLANHLPAGPGLADIGNGTRPLHRRT